MISAIILEPINENNNVPTCKNTNGINKPLYWTKISLNDILFIIIFSTIKRQSKTIASDIHIPINEYTVNCVNTPVVSTLNAEPKPPNVFLYAPLASDSIINEKVIAYKIKLTIPYLNLSSP